MKKLIILAFSLCLFNGLFAQDSSMDFDGSDDWILVGDTDPLDGTTTMTIEGWFYLDGVSNNRVFAMKQNVGSNEGNAPGWSFKTGTGTTGEGNDLRMVVNIEGSGAGAIRSIYTNNDALAGLTGGWHHFAAVYNGGEATNANRIKFYIDGVENTNKTAQGSIPTTTPTTTWNTTLGQQDGGTGAGFLDGKMDDVRLWSVAKTQGEIQASMNTELDGSEANLVAYFKFDDESASCDVVDCSSNEYHGTRNGGAQYDASVPSLTDVNCGVSFSNCSAGNAIPTMGEWALIIFGLIVLSFGVVYVMRWSKSQQYAKAF